MIVITGIFILEDTDIDVLIVIVILIDLDIHTGVDTVIDTETDAIFILIDIDVHTGVHIVVDSETDMVMYSRALEQTGSSATTIHLEATSTFDAMVGAYPILWGVYPLIIVGCIPCACPPINMHPS